MFPSTRPSAVLLTTALLCGLLAAAPVEPVRPAPGTPVRRVPDRRERIDLVFPAGEGWTQVSHAAEDGIETRGFVAEDLAGGGVLREASVTVLHGLWDVDLEKAQHRFGHQMSGDCEGVHARLWSDDPGPPARRIVLYTCGEEGAEEWTALQLLLQGPDNFYAVEVATDSGRPKDGQLVRWAEIFRDVSPCLLDGDRVPCPEDGIWPRRPR